MKMVDSLDDLKSSQLVIGKNLPNYEMLDAKMASALNKIIQNSQFKKKGEPRGTECPGKGQVSKRKIRLNFK